MMPRRELVERARRSGDLDRAARLLSASHLLLCEANTLLEEASDLLSARGLLLGEANTLLEEASDLLSARGLLLGELKQLHGRFLCSADRYFAAFSRLVGTQEGKMDMFADMDAFDHWLRRWARLSEEQRETENEKREKR